MSTVTKPILLNETGQAMVTALEAIADGFDYLKATSVTVNGTTYEQSGGNIDIGTVLRSHQDISGKMDRPTIKTVPDAVAEVNTQYYLGDRSSNVSLTLPDNAATGSLITVVFYPTTGIILDIQGDIIGEVPVPEAGQRIELNMLWDGKYWTLVSNVQEVPEVTA